MTTFGSSGVTGTITFNEAEDASTTITTYMSGTVSGKKYDMHIHSGTISAPGSVIIDLSSGTAATTTLNATKAVTNKYADMLVFDGCFVAHNFDTASTAPKYVLVGNIGKNAP